MSITRDNHYVPIWYQRGFLEPGNGQLAYRDMHPEEHRLPDGTSRQGRSRFKSSPKQCFVQRDLYTTFFGALINDEIEKHLFGRIDTDGAPAIKAFIGEDVSAWHHHFQTLFRFIDIQKLRTPKGLDWLRSHYPSLSQNELMMEMQGIQAMHCTIWSEGVREIVSAADSDVKFIISDHPVTVYNHAMPPDGDGCAYPLDPSITLKASQTIFPLDRDHCLILTNLEYAKDPNAPPLEKRTFARNFRRSLVNTINFIRTRKLADHDVTRINFVLKSRARRFIAAGREEWLYPETTANVSWADVRETLLPPENEQWHFGGEIYAKFDDGHVHYQDEFGRTEKTPEFLLKPAREREPKPNEECGCGSGLTYRLCCKSRPTALRPSWKEGSIRERNLGLYRGIVDILGLKDGRDWVEVRRELTDEKISRVHFLYQALWPTDTDLLRLLPKPDGRPRAVYTGSIHPEAITEFALGSSLYFGELIIEHPFVHAGSLKKEFSPVDRPEIFHLEFLQSVAFFLNIVPLVDLGLVNLIPDPCTFDHHLRAQIMRMARERTAGLRFDPREEPRLERLQKRDFKRHFLMGPQEALAARMRADFPEMDDAGIDEMMSGIERLKEADPLVALKDDLWDHGESRGQFMLMKMAPNFETAMYLSQATGAAIVTDSVYRWRELRRALRPRFSPPVANLGALADAIAAETFLFPSNSIDIAELGNTQVLSAYPSLMRETFRYLSRIAEKGPKLNWEAHAAARFKREHSAAQAKLRAAEVSGEMGRITCAFPGGGIQDNTINRLLLMSSSEHHLPNVPMAFFIESASARGASGW